MLQKNHTTRDQENIVIALIQRYMPFWPLFFGIILIFLFSGWLYLKWAIPFYEVTAKVIIKDEKKGVDDSEMMESINPFDSKKIIENELEVIQSREVMKSVVDSLSLYAPVLEEQSLKAISAYTTSPLKIRLKDPEAITISSDENPKHYFSFDKATKEIKVDGKTYALNTWIDFPFGTVMFLPNDAQIGNGPENPLYFEFINPKTVANALLEGLAASTTDKLSTVVTLTLENQVKRRGEDILNHLIASYNQKTINDQNKLAFNTLAFIEDRIATVERELGALEVETQEYRSDRGAIDLSEQGKLYLRDSGENDRRIADLRLQLSVLEQVEQYVLSKNNEAGIVPSTLGIDDPVLSSLLERLYNSEIKYEQLKRTTAQNNPILVSVSNEIEKIRPSILENIRNQKRNLNASLSNLTVASGKFNSVLRSLPEKERELLEINRRKAIKNDLFSFLLQKREETALAYAPTAVNTRVVDAAQASNFPVSPKPKMIYASAILLACILGIGIIFVKEVFTTKVIFRSQIEKLTEIPIIAELIHSNRKNESKYQTAKIANNEQFRNMRISLGLFGNTHTRKKFTITSSIEGDGKSFIAEKLATNLALAGKKTILVDFDFHKKNNAPIYGDSDRLGIIDLLNNKTDSIEKLVYSTPLENLFIIGTGDKGNVNPNLLLDYDISDFFDYLESQFDFIIVDTPPVCVATDAYILGKATDICLYVIRHAHTPKTFIQTLDENTNFKDIRNLYIVFNGIKNRGYTNIKFGYGYGYMQQKMAYGSYS